MNLSLTKEKCSSVVLSNTKSFEVHRQRSNSYKELDRPKLYMPQPIRHTVPQNNGLTNFSKMVFPSVGSPTRLAQVKTLLQIWNLGEIIKKTNSSELIKEMEVKDSASSVKSTQVDSAFSIYGQSTKKQNKDYDDIEEMVNF